MLEVIAIKYNGIEPVLPISGYLPADGGSIGRGYDNELVLPDPMRVLSRRHLCITRGTDGVYRLANTSASNQVMLNKQSLNPGDSTVLGDGDRITVGCYVLEVRISLSKAQSSCGHVAADGGSSGNSSLTMPGRTHPDSGESLESPLAADEDPFHDLTDTTASLSVTTMQGADALSEADAVLERATRRSIADHPLEIDSEQGLDLAELSGNCDRLLRGDGDVGKATFLASQLIGDPLSQGASALLETTPLDPLKIFGGDADELLDLFGEGRTGASGAASSVAINHQIELNTPFGLPTSEGIAELPSPFDRRSLEAMQPLQMASVSSKADRFEHESRQANANGSDSEPGPDSHPALIPDDFALEELLEPMSPEPISAPARSSCAEPLDFGAQAPREPEGPGVRLALEPSTTADSLPLPVNALEAAAFSAPFRPGHGAARPARADHHSAEELDHAALYESLLAGLQLDRLPDRRALDPAFMQTLGTLLRLSIEGTVQMMLARATVKREVRANVTLIGPKRNNPLKFSPDGGVALVYLLGSGYTGFMEPEEAMKEAFADLYNHQLAVVSGMRSALDHVLEHFDPETISKNVGSNGVIENLLTLGRKAKLWDAYGRYFEHAREQAVDRFQDFFGAAFVDAYEESARGGSLDERKEQ